MATGAVEVLLPRLVDHAHAAAADLVQQFVRRRSPAAIPRRKAASSAVGAARRLALDRQRAPCPPAPPGTAGPRPAPVVRAGRRRGRAARPPEAGPGSGPGVPTSTAIVIVRDSAVRTSRLPTFAFPTFPLLLHRLLQLPDRPHPQHLHRGPRTLHPLGHLVERQPLQVAQHDHFLVVGRQLGQARPSSATRRRSAEIPGWAWQGGGRLGHPAGESCCRPDGGRPPRARARRLAVPR